MEYENSLSNNEAISEFAKGPKDLRFKKQH